MFKDLTFHEFIAGVIAVISMVGIIVLAMVQAPIPPVLIDTLTGSGLLLAGIQIPSGKTTAAIADAVAAATPTRTDLLPPTAQAPPLPSGAP